MNWLIALTGVLLGILCVMYAAPAGSFVMFVCGGGALIGLGLHYWDSCKKKRQGP